MAVSGDQPDKGQSGAKRTCQVGKGGRKRGTRGVTDGKEWGRRVDVTLMMRERVRERKWFTSMSYIKAWKICKTLVVILGVFGI